MPHNRYIRQTTLKEFGPESQARLKAAKILVVGLGGLGVPALQYLNAMGVGTLGLVEGDCIDIHNLQRQVLYAENEVGKSKISIALKKLQAQNSETQLQSHPTYLTTANALEIIKSYDLVLDASDNFATRYLINDACVILNKPFIYGALHGFEGQVSVFNYNNGPTYRCLFPTMPSPEEVPNCDENGVLGIIPGIIGSFQALEAVKVMTGIGEVLAGKLLVYNGLTQHTRKIGLHKVVRAEPITELQDSYELSQCSTIPEIAAKAFAVLYNSAQIIDVREGHEYEQKHLIPSVHIPLVELKVNLGKLDFTKPIYFICQSGKRSLRAAAIALEYYPKSVIFSVEGGMQKLLQYDVATT
ncbi:HesA/MoeB/ThiF family protein [Croceivirga sp. JEA036]|uniref:HesA/MoeB/ThiF family protein n=1 Tax=Croceivirga sp. JEA036 TaxID=2721162 RepID=UPI001439B3CF|nr:HesA/MoeB/ThiF family protein [Croceivirga sp. JEA036]NJB35636.1 sulfurtransferase [Croceivirga sp. JEA036]